jgi:tetratricopeptide (TPR) repeat protein
MIGETVANGLEPDARGPLHGLLAQALAALGGDPGELAAHWLGAGDAGLAAAAYLKAAQRALDGLADTEAISLATAGLDLEPPTETAAALQEIRAEARGRRGDIVGARTDLRAALSAELSGPARSRLLGKLAMLTFGADDLVRAGELAEVALVEAGSDRPARARALEIAALLDMNLDRRERADARAGDALSLYQELGDAKGAARVLDARAMATFLAGDVAGGTALLERAANLFEDSGDLVRVMTPRSTAGHGLVFAGDPAAGLTRTTSALELARTLGHPEGQTYALWHTAEALAALDRHEEARAAGEEALEIAQRIGHRGWTATAWRAIGIARQGAGDLDAALLAFQQSLDNSANLGLFASWAASRCALVMLALGRVDDAAAFVERALSEGPPLGHFEARWAEAELAAARGDSHAAELARSAVQLAEGAGVKQAVDRLTLLAD